MRLKKPDLFAQLEDTRTVISITGTCWTSSRKTGRLQLLLCAHGFKWPQEERPPWKEVGWRFIADGAEHEVLRPTGVSARSYKQRYTEPHQSGRSVRPQELLWLGEPHLRLPETDESTVFHSAEAWSVDQWHSLTA
jgi:hypothetical protein